MSVETINANESISLSAHASEMQAALSYAAICEVHEIPAEAQSLLQQNANDDDYSDNPYIRALEEEVIERYRTRHDWLAEWGKEVPEAGTEEEEWLDDLMLSASLNARDNAGQKENIIAAREELFTHIGMRPAVIREWKKQVPSFKPANEIAEMTRVIAEYGASAPKFFRVNGPHISLSSKTLRGYLQDIAREGYGVKRILQHEPHHLTNIHASLQRTSKTWQSLDLTCVPAKRGEVAVLSPLEIRSRVAKLAFYGVGTDKIRHAPSIMVLRQDTIDRKFRLAQRAAKTIGEVDDYFTEGLASHPVALELGIAKSIAVLRIFATFGDQAERDTLSGRTQDTTAGNFLTIIHRTPIERIMDLADEKAGGEDIELIETIWKNFAEMRSDNGSKPKDLETCLARWPNVANHPNGKAIIRSYLRTTVRPYKKR